MRDEFSLCTVLDDLGDLDYPPDLAAHNAQAIDLHVVHSRLIEYLARGDADAVADLKSLADHLYREATERTCPPIYLILVEEAHALAQEGLFADAARRLECCVRPKWDTIQACGIAFARAGGRAYGPPSPQFSFEFIGQVPA